jgi:hypothetical protein
MVVVFSFHGVDTLFFCVQIEEKYNAVALCLSLCKKEKKTPLSLSLATVV